MAGLPGDVRLLSPQTTETCEECDKQATRRIQGETDSFGAEHWYYCDEHYEVEKKRLDEADRSGTCEWCKTHKPKLSHRRDYDEGQSGPVYQVCDECIDKHNQYINDNY